MSALTETTKQTDQEEESVRSLALGACRSVMDAVAGHCDWHPNPSVDVADWNENAHIEVTLTIKDLRKVKVALMKGGMMTKDEMKPDDDDVPFCCFLCDSENVDYTSPNGINYCAPCRKEQFE